jgi:hypothetical protein
VQRWVLSRRGLDRAAGYARGTAGSGAGERYVIVNQELIVNLTVISLICRASMPKSADAIRLTCMTAAARVCLLYLQ